MSLISSGPSPRSRVKRVKKGSSQRGEYATRVTPSSLHASSTPFVSTSVDIRLYSHWTASILATLDARRRVAAEHSLRPM